VLNSAMETHGPPEPTGGNAPADPPRRSGTIRYHVGIRTCEQIDALHAVTGISRTELVRRAVEALHDLRVLGIVPAAGGQVADR
jgi:hypothetical protein